MRRVGLCVQRGAASHACGTDGLTVHPVNAVTGGEHSSTEVCVPAPETRMYPSSSISTEPFAKRVAGSWPIATKMPSAGNVPVSPVTVSRMSTKPAESSAVSAFADREMPVEEGAFDADPRHSASESSSTRGDFRCSALRCRSGYRISACLHAGGVFLPANGCRHRIHFHGDLGIVQHALDHDLGGAELVAAVQHGHRRAETSQEQCLFERAVSSAHHDDGLVLEEETIAGGAIRYAVTGILGLAGNAELAVL